MACKILVSLLKIERVSRENLVLWHLPHLFYVYLNTLNLSDIALRELPATWIQ